LSTHVVNEAQSHRHPFLDGRPKKLLIGGEWVPARTGRLIESFNPSTGDSLGTIAAGGAEDVEDAVAAARRAFEGPWSKLRPFHRQDILLKFAELVERHFEELSWLDVLDMGVPISVALGRRQRVIGMIRYYAGMATAIHGETIENSMPGGTYTSFTLKEPIGVVGAIIPWNGPLIASVWKISPVLATGCTMVLKPSEEASFTSLRLGELLLEAGLPEGVLNIVTGYGDAGAALAAHPHVDKIAFTGSTKVGQQIVQASAGNLKKLSLELGGKSPDIVLADADLDAAVPGAAMAVFANSGQVCSAGTRLFVARPIYDEFTARVAEFGKGLKVGNSADKATQIGPIVSAKQLQSVLAYLDAGKQEGAVALSGGQRLTGGPHDRGHFVSPTVFSQVTDEMKIAREEIFGPVISALPFDGIEDVVRRANANPFGLGSGVWTRDVGSAHRLAKSIRAGSVWINCYQATDPAVPFGGYKMSGYGRESGLQHLEEFLNVKSVWIRTD
jgi:aldehyde dehydrogenase (NAD+)